MLNAEWKIRRLWVAAGKITQVDFEITFSSAEAPDTTSGHRGQVSIVDAALPETATNDAIIAAIRAGYGDEWAGLEFFHASQIAFQQEAATSTVIDVDVPADPDGGFPPLQPLDFWLIALEIGVTEASVAADIDAMPEGRAKEEARLYFTKAQRYRRYDPLLMDLATKQGVTSEELDHLWLWGAPASAA